MIKYFIKKIPYIILFYLISNFSIGQSLKIMSYNIRYDNNWDKAHSWQDRKTAVVSILKHYKPVIFGIQEGLLNQVSYIDEKLKNYKYIGEGRDGGTKGEYSALFFDTTKIKLIKKGTFWLSETPTKPSKGWDAALNRICTYGLFEKIKTKEKLWVFNTHFDHIGKKARINSAKLILNKIHLLNANGYAVVMMGDLNDTPNKEPIKILSKRLNDALNISKKPLKGPEGTFNAFTNSKTKRRIDYFFVEKIKVLKYVHINDMSKNNKFISDHFPIFMTVKIVK